MASVIPGGRYETVLTVLSDTSETTCLTVLDGSLSYYVTEIRAADDGGEARTVTLVATINGTAYTLVFQGAIATNAPLEYEFKPLVLKYNKASSTGDTIKATASAGGVHVLITYLDNGRPTTGAGGV